MDAVAECFPPRELKMDAILCDPPYGHRSSIEGNQNADDILIHLFKTAQHLLKPGGRLVFWTKTDLSNPLSEETIDVWLSRAGVLDIEAHENKRGLRLVGFANDERGLSESANEEPWLRTVVVLQKGSLDKNSKTAHNKLPADTAKVDVAENQYNGEVSYADVRLRWMKNPRSINVQRAGWKGDVKILELAQKEKLDIKYLILHLGKISKFLLMVRDYLLQVQIRHT